LGGSANDDREGKNARAHGRSGGSQANDAPSWGGFSTRIAQMHFHDELDLLDEEQTAIEAVADEAGLSGLDRRQFVFLSLASAAATTFGFSAKVLAQGTGGAGAAGAGNQQQQPPLP